MIPRDDEDSISYSSRATVANAHAFDMSVRARGHADLIRQKFEMNWSRKKRPMETYSGALMLRRLWMTLLFSQRE